MPPIAGIAVEAAAVAKNRRRDTGMRWMMECLQFMGREWCRLLTRRGRTYDSSVTVDIGGELTRFPPEPEGAMRRSAGSTARDVHPWAEPRAAYTTRLRDPGR